MVDVDSSKVIIIDKDFLPTDKSQTDREIVSFVMRTLRQFKDARRPLEDTWLESWASYLGTPEATHYERSKTLETVGAVNNNWRHRINVGKAFGVIEDLHAHLMSAIFPSEQWMNLEPEEPMLRVLTRVLRKYFADRLYDWKFRAHFANYLRQLLIVGGSAMAIPWSDKHSIEFETLDVFDVFLDPYAVSVEESPWIRQVIKTRAEIAECIETGKYYNINTFDLVNINTGEDVYYSESRDRIREFQGIQLKQDYSWQDKIRIIEYWGDVHLRGATHKNKVVTCIGGHLVRFEDNGYDCGVPFVYGTYIPVVRQPHGISAIQASLGLLHEMNIITNQRLDNLEISLNQMYTLKSDGTLRAEEVISEPGRVFEVAEHDDLRPVVHNNSDVSISYTESQFLEAQVDKNSGTGPLVGVGMPRGGERVTAEEIKAVRDAGGNRLSNQHKHIEDTSLVIILEKTLANVRQFTSQDSIVKIAQIGASGNEYYQVGAREVRGAKYKIRPRTASHVIERQEYIARRTEFIQLIMQVPQFAERIDYDKILVDLVSTWFDDPESYLIQKAPEQEQAQGGSLFKMGGRPMEQAAIEQLAADGGRDLFSKLTGQQLPEGMTVDDLLNSTDSATSTLNRLESTGVSPSNNPNPSSSPI